MRKYPKTFDYSERNARFHAERAGLTDYGIVEQVARDGVREFWARQAFNVDVHRHLVGLGYAFQPFPAEFDDGDPESGPGSDGSPPWDQYEGPDDRIVIDDGGHVVHCETRDLALEALIDIQCGGPEGF